MLLNNLGEEEIARKVEQYFEQKNENETVLCMYVQVKLHCSHANN